MKPPAELAEAFKARPIDAHKYSVGTVAVIGGSSHYVHAPVIAGLGARAAGAGLVQLVVPDASRIAAGVHLPEATFTKLVPTCIPPRADVSVVGMGLGVTLNTQALVSRLLSGSAGRFVLDADALTILAGWYGTNDGYEPSAGQELVLTPHEGEAARLLDAKPDETIVDAYCGVGTISLLLAQHAGRVIGIESVPEAIRDAKRNAADNGIQNAEFLCGNVEDVLPTLPGRIDGLVIDPPRTGCDERVLAAIAHSGASRVVYVSCNPATLARDCKLLAAHGFRLISATPVDMFPQTAHVETIVLLQRETL